MMIYLDEKKIDLEDLDLVITLRSSRLSGNGLMLIAQAILASVNTSQPFALAEVEREIILKQRPDRTILSNLKIVLQAVPNDPPPFD